MTDDPHIVSADERGTVRVFTTDLEPEGDASITAQNVHKLLGEDISLNADKVEVFPSKVLEGMGLAAYLREGYGIPQEDMAGKAAALDAQKGLIILLPASAFGGAQQTLDPNPALRFVGMFKEPGTAAPVSMATPAADAPSAKPASVPRSSPQSRPGSWMIALGALIIAAALVIFAVF